MLDPLGPLPRESDHGPIAQAVGWICPQCTGEYSECPPEREIAQCSMCQAEIGPCCRKISKCHGCAEHCCIEHLEDVAQETTGMRPESWCPSCRVAVICANCGEIKFDIEEYDFGTDPETGYRDSGRACTECRGR